MVPDWLKNVPWHTNHPLVARHIVLEHLLYMNILSMVISLVAISGGQTQLFIDQITDGTFVAPNVTIINSCIEGNIICSQIAVQLNKKSSFVFQESSCVDCMATKQHKRSGKSQKTIIPLLIDDDLTCSPNYWNPEPVQITAVRLYVFEIHKSQIRTSLEKKYSQIRHSATKRIAYDLRAPPPYSRRRCLKLRSKCESFGHKLKFWRFIHQSSSLVRVPLGLAEAIFASHHSMGLYLDNPQASPNHFFNRFMESNRRTFSICLWIYLSSPCPNMFCNILSFFDGVSEGFTSPTILLTSSGQIHFQVRLRSKKSDSAFRTHYQVGLRCWNQIVLSINSNEWSMSLFSLNGTLIGFTDVTRFSEPIHLNIRKDFGIAGGSQAYVGFQGFVSEIYLYPGLFGRHHQIHRSRLFRASSHRVQHEHRAQDCAILIQELEFYFTLLRNKLIAQQSQQSCFKKEFFRQTYNNRNCSLRPRDLKRPKIYRFLKLLISQDLWLQKTMKRLLKIDLKNSFLGESNSFADVLGQLRTYIFDAIRDEIKKKGIKLSKTMVNYLRDASCLDDPDATYILATTYYYGLGLTNISTDRVLDLLLINAERHQHRLSLLALGNIYNLLLIPGVTRMSSVFYKAVADLTPKDIDQISKDDMYNDNIRLINEAAVKEHTDEDGDLFQWITHQASAGIPWAKQQLGQIMYWGQQGIQRNFDAAVNFFRMAAEGPEAQPEDHFDYGLLLVKKPKEEKDFEKGKAELELASEKDPRALTVLGWLAENKEGNITKAYEYYSKAYKMGNAVAAFNLGIYHHYGKKPIVNKNKMKAFNFFQEAALGNQINAGAMYSHYLLSGIDGFLPVNVNVAINWARYIGEQNPKIGYFLSEGVRAFRHKRIEISIFYYLLAAFTGLELANFNVAYLCEEHEAMVRKYVTRECIWYHYNLSLEREEHQIHKYSLIKMGDKNWYGCQGGQRNISKSIDFYIRAARKKEPQAFFNLGFILEHEDIEIPHQTLQTIIELPDEHDNSSKAYRHDLVLRLYQRCEQLSDNDGYIPCRLAAHRMWLAIQWADIKFMIQTFVAMVLTAALLYKFIELWRASQANDAVFHNISEP